MDNQQLTKKERAALKRQQKLAARQQATKQAKKKSTFWWIFWIAIIVIVIAIIAWPSSDSIDSPGGDGNALMTQSEAAAVAPTDVGALADKPADTVHEHADLAFFINGEQLDLTQAKYQSPEGAELHKYMHLHDGVGHIVHKRAKGISMGEFFDSLGINLTNECLTLDIEEEYCNEEVASLKFYVNDQPVSDLASYEFQDLDRILMSYGAESPIAMPGQLKAVTDEACIYSEKCPERGSPPTESCVGGLGTDCEVDGEAHQDDKPDGFELPDINIFEPTQE